VPKRPPRLEQEIPVPPDLHSDRTEVAYRDQAGTLWRADAIELITTLGDSSVDLVVADPPYAIGKATWDEFSSMDAYLTWCDQWLAQIARVLTPHGSAYVCGFSEILADIKVRAAPRFGGCRWLVWYYRNKANLGKDWGRSHESILHLRRSRETRIFVDAVRVPYNGHTVKYPNRVQAVSSQYGGGKHRDHWEPNPLGAKPRDVFEIPVLCNGMEEKTQHETQKPEELIEKLILASSVPGQLVFDPFVGSGTTAVVAARLGRRWLACDADARYVGVARERMRAAMATAAAPHSLAAPRPAKTRPKAAAEAVTPLDLKTARKPATASNQIQLALEPPAPARKVAATGKRRPK
jgi:site-specific DNA-methyltransferase (adenine-specific)